MSTSSSSKDARDNGAVAAGEGALRRTILVTGSEGLVGTALVRALAGAGFDPVRLDRNAPPGGARADVRDPTAVRCAVARCAGVVHLAAVSRVIWGERDPHTCRQTNVDGTRHVLEAALDAPRRPWVLFASSREVYGSPGGLPASEETPLEPINVYGRSKLQGERLVEEARGAGLRAAVVRLSNVYGSTADHPDRVVPAFARSAAVGAPLRVEGSRNTFDFTHLDDAVHGILALVRALEDGEDDLPPIHLLTGVPTTLGELAALAVACAGTAAEIVAAPSRSFDVSHFYGCPRRAEEILGWRPRVPIQEGLARLVTAFQAEIGRAAAQEVS